MISEVRKRDGTIVPFDVDKIAVAVEKSMLAVGIDEEDLPKTIALKSSEAINLIHPEEYIPSVEEVQDVVEKTLIDQGLPWQRPIFFTGRSELN